MFILNEKLATKLGQLSAVFGQLFGMLGQLYTMFAQLLGMLGQFVQIYTFCNLVRVAA